MSETWSVGEVVRVGSLAAVAFFVLNVFFESNVRALLERHGWDQFLSRWVEKLPQLLRDRRSFWCAFGVAVGVTGMAWIPQIALPETPKPQSQGMLWTATPGTPLNPRTDIVGKGYTEEQRKKIINKLSNLRDLLDTEAQPIRDQVNKAMEYWGADPKGTVEKLTAVQTKIVTASAAIMSTLAGAYQDETEPPVSEVTAESGKLKQEIARSIENFKTLAEESDHLRKAILTGDVRRIQEASNSYTDAVNLARINVERKLHLFMALKP